jgi:hypothetical protein
MKEEILMLLTIWELEGMQAQMPLIPGELPAHSAPITGLCNYSTSLENYRPGFRLVYMANGANTQPFDSNWSVRLET